mgnify:CR=1 FL=1
MKELYDLRDSLCNELKKYAKKELTAGSLDVVDKLSHSIKCIDRILEKGDSYSNAGRPYVSMNNMRRDGYSYDDSMTAKLYEMMEETPDERKRQEFKRFIQRMETM